MSDFNERLRRWQRQSREVGFQARAVLLVLAVSGVLGVLIHAAFGPKSGHYAIIGPMVVSFDPENGPQFNFREGTERFAAREEAFRQLELAREARDWSGVVYWTVCLDLIDLGSPMLILSLVAGAVWTIIIAQFAGFERALLARYLAALLLGFISATVTLVVVELQALRGFTEGDNFLDNMIFWIAGVGLREEAIKLLCFTPLVPLLVRRDDVDALVCGAMVGIGFAVQENVNYFMEAGAGNAFGRMMTANFLHMALTALAARALVRLVRRPKRHWEEFLGTFLGVVVIHGLYDAFISVPELQGFSLATFIILVALAWQFCGMLGVVGRNSRARAFSPGAVFVLGVAVLTGSVFLFLCLIAPPAAAAVLCGEQLVSLFTIAAVFAYRLHEE